MFKKGQAEIIGAIIVLSIVAYGGFFLMQEDNVTGLVIKETPDYVGDYSNHKFCLVNEENIQNIHEENRILFYTTEQADKLDFIFSTNCK